MFAVGVWEGVDEVGADEAVEGVVDCAAGDGELAGDGEEGVECAGVGKDEEYHEFEDAEA